MEPPARCEPADNVTVPRPTEESGCVLARGKDAELPPHMSVLICLCEGVP